jgi:hypothetical protein
MGVAREIIHPRARTLKMKYAVGDKVKVLTVRGTVSADEENSWEIVELGERGYCLIRNDFDQARAQLKGKNTQASEWDTSLITKATPSQT